MANFSTFLSSMLPLSNFRFSSPMSKASFTTQIHHQFLPTVLYIKAITRTSCSVVVVLVTTYHPDFSESHSPSCSSSLLLLLLRLYYYYLQNNKLGKSNLNKTQQYIFYGPFQLLDINSIPPRILSWEINPCSGNYYCAEQPTSQ